MIRRRASWIGASRRAPGQALIIVALTLGILITLAVLGAEVSLHRRTLTRLHYSADTATLAGLQAIDPPSLAANAPRLNAARADLLTRAALARELRRIRGALTESPETIAGSAQVTILQPGERCGNRSPASGPAICLRVRAEARGALIVRQYVYETFAQATTMP